MAEYFETSFGDKIPVDLAIEKKLYPLSADEAFVRDIAENSYASDRFHEQNTTTKVGIKKIASDLITFTLLIDYLDEMRLLNRTYDTVLDIAGAEGIHASLFRGHYAEHASVADVADGADPQLTQKLKRALWKYRAYKIQDRLLGKARRLKDKKHVNTPSFKNYYNFSFKRTPKVDEFIVGDWRKTLSKRYDFIMNYMSFWMWDHTSAIPKIADALNPGGIFATLAPYCWCGRQIGDSGGVFGGGFPFFEQRLTKEDTLRYYQQFKPHLSFIVDEAWGHFDIHRPTLAQQVKAAQNSGLVVLGTKRLYNNDPNVALTWREKFGERMVYNPAGKNPVVADAGEVLQNISRFRNDITFEDLITRGVILVFQKPL